MSLKLFSSTPILGYAPLKPDVLQEPCCSDYVLHEDMPDVLLEPVCYYYVLQTAEADVFLELGSYLCFFSQIHYSNLVSVIMLCVICSFDKLFDVNINIFSQGDFTRTGERKISGMMKDGVNSANRYYFTMFILYLNAILVYSCSSWFLVLKKWPLNLEYTLKNIFTVY